MTISTHSSSRPPKGTFHLTTTPKDSGYIIYDLRWEQKGGCKIYALWSKDQVSFSEGEEPHILMEVSMNLSLSVDMLADLQRTLILAETAARELRKQEYEKIKVRQS